MDENEVADQLFEALDRYDEDEPAPLAGFKVSRDDTGVVLTSPDGEVFRAIVVQVA